MAAPSLHLPQVCLGKKQAKKSTSTVSHVGHGLTKALTEWSHTASIRTDSWCMSEKGPSILTAQVIRQYFCHPPAISDLPALSVHISWTYMYQYNVILVQGLFWQTTVRCCKHSCPLHPVLLYHPLLTSFLLLLGIHITWQFLHTEAPLLTTCCISCRRAISELPVGWIIQKPS